MEEELRRRSLERPFSDETPEGWIAGWRSATLLGLADFLHGAPCAHPRLLASTKAWGTGTSGDVERSSHMSQSLAHTEPFGAASSASSPVPLSAISQPRLRISMPRRAMCGDTSAEGLWQVGMLECSQALKAAQGTGPRKRTQPSAVVWQATPLEFWRIVCTMVQATSFARSDRHTAPRAGHEEEPLAQEANLLAGVEARHVVGNLTCCWTPDKPFSCLHYVGFLAFLVPGLRGPKRRGGCLGAPCRRKKLSPRPQQGGAISPQPGPSTSPKRHAHFHSDICHGHRQGRDVAMQRVPRLAGT